MSANANEQTTLITADELKSPLYGIAKDIRPDRIEPYVLVASERLRAWVGDAAYDDVLDQTDISALTTAEQRRILARRKILKTAEGDLAMHFLTLNLNTFITAEGQLLEAQTEGQTTHRYLNPDQILKAAQAWLDQAVMLAEPYRIKELEAHFAVAEVAE